VYLDLSYLVSDIFVFCVDIIADIVYLGYYFYVIRTFHLYYKFLLIFLVIVMHKIHCSRYLTSSASS